VWLTGLSASGKTTIAGRIEERLTDLGQAVFVLDGDVVRQGLCCDLGFSPEDRDENIRRIGEVAALFAQAGVVAVVAFISPYRAGRERARAAAPAGSFVEVHVSTSIEVCEQRDPKGLYRRARTGEVPEFTGISAPYEPPPAPEVEIDAGVLSPEECTEAILAALRRRGLLQPEPVTAKT
jgi:adenylyl-sulfate kinase